LPDRTDVEVETTLLGFNLNIKHLHRLLHDIQLRWAEHCCCLRVARSSTELSLIRALPTATTRKFAEVDGASWATGKAEDGGKRSGSHGLAFAETPIQAAPFLRHVLWLREIALPL
jgi:hypothetical protein